MRVLKTVLAALAVTLALNASAAFADDDITGERWAVIFAPGKYAELPESETHAAGAKRMHSRLLKSRFAADHIVLLTGDEADSDGLLAAVEKLAGTVKTNDVLLVAVHSYGVHDGKLDYITTSSTSEADLAAAARGRAPDSLVPVARLAAEMAQAVTTQQVLLVDGYTNADVKVESTLTEQFGLGELPLKNGQCVLLNRSAASKKGRTEFVAAVCDALSENADGNGDELVSRSEFTEHVKLYEKTEKLAGVHSVELDDFSLAGAGPGDADSFSREQRDSVATALLKSSRVLYLIENETEEAQKTLKRAVAYRPSTRIRGEIVGMLLTILASQGEFEQAWKEAEGLDSDLLYFVSNELNIQSGDDILGKLQPGELVRFSQRSDEWFQPVARYKVTFRKGAVAFTSVPTPPDGWVDSEAMRPAEPVTDDQVRSLTEILRQLNGEPAANARASR